MRSFVSLHREGRLSPLEAGALSSHRRASIRVPIVLLALICLNGLLAQAAPASARVELVRTPNQGIQPQVAMDAAGAVHLIYYKGNDRGGDVFYVRQEPGQAAFSNPIQVNSQKGSAIAAGTIRGAQLALGKKGRVHVVWNGGSGAARVAHEGAPLLYARMNDTGTGFETERDLITFAAGLDGGSSVAADADGNVYVAWHAHHPGNKDGEAGRAVFVARSTDEGKTFAREKQANPKPTGACACCGLRAFADQNGVVYILYRGASQKVNRDEILLVSRNRGLDFEIANAHRWNIPTCPMSSASLTPTKAGALAAWETEGQVYFATVDSKTLKVSNPTAPPGKEKRKHPALAANAAGETLLAWTEGTGWQKGGSVAWQLYDSQGQPAAEQGKTDGVPVWSLATTFAKPDGRFVIVY